MRRLAVVLLLATGCMVSRSHDTPLVDAVRSGDAPQIRALCARGADPNEPSGGNGWTPLLHAIHKNQIESVKALLDAGANIDRTSPSQTSPLMMAAGYGSEEMVALLLQRGANPRLSDDEGASALDYALSGVPDLDAFTLFRCQNSTVKLLKRVSPPAQANSERWARIKGCE